jgi:hypothetical protein
VLRLRAKKAPLAGKARAFSPKNRQRNPQKGGRRGVFFFREMSDFKALARIFLPTLTPNQLIA